MSEQEDCPHADRLRRLNDAGDEGPVTGPLERELRELSPDQATTAVARALTSVVRDLHQRGILRLEREDPAPQTPESVAAARAARDAEFDRHASQLLLGEMVDKYGLETVHGWLQLHAIRMGGVL